MIKIALAGSTGRMGRAIIREIAQESDMQLVCALGNRGSQNIGCDAGELAGIEPLGVAVTVAPNPQTHLGDMDILIDFTRPNALAAHLKICREISIPMVIGTTGLSAQQNQAMSSLSEMIPVMVASNTSVAVNLCASLVETASRVLRDKFDIEVIEAHHKHKVDAPSGTALLLAEAAASAQGLDLLNCGVFAREGQAGERQPGSIGFSTIRGGDIAGEHTVMFIGEHERIEITHRATNRRIFAVGALRAARWLVNQEKGLYSMQDMLDLY